MPNAPSPPIIRCRQVCVSYGKQEVLRDVSFTVPRGCLLPLVGPNGAGKTTLLKALLGLAPLRSGSIESPFAHVPPGYVPQVKTIDPIFPVSVRRIVEMGLYPRLGWRRRPTAEQAQALDAVLADFDLLDHQRKIFGELSGGMKQKTLLARAFVTNAPVMLLDEPTSELDEPTEREVLDRLHRLVEQQQCTILFVHHALHQAARLAPQLCWVEHGSARLIPAAAVAANGNPPARTIGDE